MRSRYRDFSEGSQQPSPSPRYQMTLAWEHVERYRDRTFRRLRSLRVRGERSALRFINEVGFCTAFSRHEHVPCLWVAVCGTRRPRMPRHTHHDYAIGLTWDLKDRLPDARRVLYAKLLHGKPSLISLEYAPYFYRVFGPQGCSSAHQALGLPEQGILDWLLTHPPQPTHQLRLHGDFSGYLKKTRFEKAIARLQELFCVVKTRTVYEPKFTYIWGRFEDAFPQAVRQAGRISYEGALEKILRKYFAMSLCARQSDLLSIFPGVDAAKLQAKLEDLAREHVILSRLEIKGVRGAWYFLNRDKMTPH